MKKLLKRLIPVKLFKTFVPLWHFLNALYYQTRAGFPGRHFKVIGVTGTDGKTSTITLIAQMLRHSGKKVGLITTISIDYGEGEQPNPTRLTALSAKDFVKDLKLMREHDVEYLVLEVTAHGLHQFRSWGVPMHLAVMTNVTHEHLDYFGTFEKYRDAKRRLFKIASRNHHGLRTGIVNADDPSAKLFVGDIKHPVTYGLKQADYVAKNIKLDPSGSEYIAKTKDADYQITCHLPGSFNVYNSLATVAAGQALGLSKEDIESGIASLPAVEGRMTHVDEGQDFAAIVDYAHTPDGFEKIFKEVRPLVKGRLICVFGSAGRRDEAKRGTQGKIAGKECDIVIATEEDDRDIDGQEILEQIANGAKSSGKALDKDLFLVHDREKAIRFAVNMAKKNDLIVFLGKGHEKSILYNGSEAAKLRHLPQDDSDPKRVLKRDFDEVTEVRKALKELQRSR